ncbi:MAG: zinc ribbon domain-containing protein [Myxococcales bacterium]|nr:MAG: zinc ribbon domain-containing protein [Myxococcales bacterium]
MGVFQGLWRFSRRALIALAALAAMLATCTSAYAQAPTLAGTWTASPLAVSWQLGDWGKACGPAPSGGGEGGGTVTITQSGNELAFAGAGRSYTTSECWEQYPGIQRISHSASARSFQNVCKTAAGDPRQTKLVTTLSATDNRINFDETGQYQFVIEGQNCTASVRRTRSYTLVRRLGEEVAPAPSVETPSPAPTPTPRPAKPCENAGLPERLEVRPSHKLMRPGESFEFRTIVLDARGCALPVTPTWRVVSGASLLSVTAPGKVTASPTAGESKATLEVTLGDRSVRVDVEIASKERYDAVLQAQGLSETGESKEAAVLRVASESMGAREVVARDEAPSQSRWIVAVAGASALVLGLLGLWLVRRSRAAANAPPREEPPSTPRASLPPDTAKACPTCREEFPPEAEFCPNDGNRLVSQSALSVGPGGAVCPVCGRGFNPGTSICPEHGEELVPAAAFVPVRAPTLVVTRTICPLCGKQYGGEIRFCGECGAAVVPIN